jgi:hypothetical protein
MESAQFPAWQLVQQGCEDGAVGPRECGLGDLALQDGELVA